MNVDRMNHFYDTNVQKLISIIIVKFIFSHNLPLQNILKIEQMTSYTRTLSDLMNFYQN